MAIWYILWPFGNVAVIWYIFLRFGKLCQEKSGSPDLKLELHPIDRYQENLFCRDSALHFVEHGLALPQRFVEPERVGGAVVGGELDRVLRHKLESIA
jgi:hypothetical protein